MIGESTIAIISTLIETLFRGFGIVYGEVTPPRTNIPGWQTIPCEILLLRHVPTRQLDRESKTFRE